MNNKTKARTAATVTGQTAQNVSDLQGKDKAFPHEFPENLDLNDLPQVDDPPKVEKAETDKPAIKKKGDSEALIVRIGKHLGKAYSFRYNLIKNAVEFQRIGQIQWIEVDERQALRIEAELLRKGLKGIGRTLHVFLSNATEFNPISEYLDSLPTWDGKTDHIVHLAGFVEVKPARREWFNLMFKKHLVRLLACASGRIPFNKQCFVFVSEQNDGKTSFLRFLCPPEWSEYYSEDIDFENKDGLIALARNIFINLDELRNLSRQDINKVKSYLSKDQIKARLPFDRRETKLKRHASFFGSTNNAEFLTDETGNVRWLVFEIDGIRHDNGGPNGYNANININDMYAQAYALLNSGFAFQLTKEEIEQSEEYNQAHTIKPIEYDLILKYFDESTDAGDFKTATEIKLRLEIQTLNKLSPVNVGKALKMLRIERHPKKIKGKTVHGYYMKETEGVELGKVKEDENEKPPF